MRSIHARGPARSFLLLGLVATLGTGCRLIDQTTFAPDPEPPGSAQLASAAQPIRRVPLVTIRYDVPDPSYQELLRYALQAARQRDANTQFDVVAVTPGVGGAPGAAAASIQARTDAVDVMRTMMTLGVPAQSIRLAARTDAAAVVREVRVYVR